jgi:hypothetical protein
MRRTFVFHGTRASSRCAQSDRASSRTTTHDPGRVGPPSSAARTNAYRFDPISPIPELPQRSPRIEPAPGSQPVNVQRCLVNARAKRKPPLSGRAPPSFDVLRLSPDRL